MSEKETCCESICYRDVLRVETSGLGSLNSTLRPQQLGFERHQSNGVNKYRMGYKDSTDTMRYFDLEHDHDDRYLQLTGGILTGVLEIDPDSIQHSSALIIKGDTDTPLSIERKTGSSLRFCVRDDYCQLQFRGKNNGTNLMISDESVENLLQVVRRSYNLPMMINTTVYNVYHDGNLDILKRDLNLNGDFLPRDGSKPMTGALELDYNAPEIIFGNNGGKIRTKNGNGSLTVDAQLGSINLMGRGITANSGLSAIHLVARGITYDCGISYHTFKGNQINSEHGYAWNGQNLDARYAPLSALGYRELRMLHDTISGNGTEVSISLPQGWSRGNTVVFSCETESPSTSTWIRADGYRLTDDGKLVIFRSSSSTIGQAVRAVIARMN